MNTGPENDFSAQIRAPFFLRAETLARLSLFQKGRIPGRGSTRQLDKRRSIRQRLTSSGQRKQAEESEGEEGSGDIEEEDAKETTAEAADGEAKVGNEPVEGEPKTEEKGDCPEETGGAPLRVVGLGPGLRIGHQAKAPTAGRSEQVLEPDAGRDGEASRAEAERKGKAKADEPAPPSHALHSGSGPGGLSEVVQALETVAEVCKVVRTDPDAILATVALLVRDVVGLPAAEPIRPLLGSMLALCERAQRADGPLRALGNLVAVAQGKVGRATNEGLDANGAKTSGGGSGEGKTERRSGKGAIENEGADSGALGLGSSSAAKARPSVVKYSPRPGLRVEIDGTSQMQEG